jgi:hypothetical protein
MNSYYITLPSSNKNTLYSLVSGISGVVNSSLESLNLKGVKTMVSGIPFAWNSKPIYIGDSGYMPFVLDSGKHDGLTLGFNSLPTGNTKLSHLYVQGTSGDGLFVCF